MSLPAADELFRTTGGAGVQPSAPSPEPSPSDGPAGHGGTGGRASVPPGQGEPRPPASAGSGDPVPNGSAVRREGAAEGAAAEEAPVPGQGRRPAAGRAPVPAAPDRTGSGRNGAAGPRNGQPSAKAAPRRGRAARRPSGRERHDEKITVYVSAEELMDLEHARLVLRGEHGLAVDRGRIVREAVAVVLADLESRGDASILVRRLRGR
ncbi:hypothetical protein [Streptomyces sodiiphilus]|uniref:hypothetical protein n=1 Tax=Streptomyces sodiiphilus TaxID=226217 RepID=UPI0031CE749C